MCFAILISNPVHNLPPYGANIFVLLRKLEFVMSGEFELAAAGAVTSSYISYRKQTYYIASFLTPTFLDFLSVKTYRRVLMQTKRSYTPRVGALRRFSAVLHTVSGR